MENNNNEPKKICMYCSTVYEGDPRNYDPNNLSHGICQSYKCKVEALSHAYQISTKSAEEMLESIGGLERKLDNKA